VAGRVNNVQARLVVTVDGEFGRGKIISLYPYFVLDYFREKRKGRNYTNKAPTKSGKA